MEREKPDPSSVTISVTQRVVVTPGSTVLDLQDTPDDSDGKSALKELLFKNYPGYQSLEISFLLLVLFLRGSGTQGIKELEVSSIRLIAL